MAFKYCCTASRPTRWSPAATSSASSRAKAPDSTPQHAASGSDSAVRGRSLRTAGSGEFLRPSEAKQASSDPARHPLRGRFCGTSRFFSHFFTPFICARNFFTYLCTAKAPHYRSRDSGRGPFVYRFGRKIFILERAVRFCYGLPTGRRRAARERGGERKTKRREAKDRRRSEAE